MKPREPKNLQPKLCAQCGKEFTPQYTTTQIVCSLNCAKRLARNSRLAKVQAEKQETKRRKEAIETIPELIKEAQREFNGFCRARDRLAGHPCISSGRQLDWSGNGVDAGHYRSVGSAPHLRFDERNCHAQSKHDNQWRAGNAVDYRLGLIERIGLEAVEALEADNRVHKWTREELRSIRDTYRQKRRDLERLIEEQEA